MSARPSVNYGLCYTRPCIVKTGNTVGRGRPFKIDSFSSDGTPIIVPATAAGDSVAGVSRDDGAAGEIVRGDFLGSGVVLGKVGTGGATAGEPAKPVADGMANATVGGATTKLTVVGQWLETGVAGDLCAINLGAASCTVGS